jgi:hypothetical protein
VGDLLTKLAKVRMNFFHDFENKLLHFSHNTGRGIFIMDFYYVKCALDLFFFEQRSFPYNDTDFGYFRFFHFLGC